jgi:protein phosphatase
MTDKGRNRARNEDSLLCLAEKKIFMVADGVGGHKAGELASSLATDLVRAYFKEHPIEDSFDVGKIKEYCQTCLLEVNRSIFERANVSAENAGMATTAILLYVNSDQAFVANVGDSRAYLMHDNRLQRLTEDHSYVNELMKKGQITEEEALHHPNRNMITRALGSEETLEPDFYHFKVESGDRILLCTDGLYNEIDEEEILSILKGGENTDDLVRDLISRANENGGRDNITVICVDL